MKSRGETHIIRGSPLLLLCRLVDKINVSIGQDPTSKSLIGVLDIYGFESFKHNRWELRIDEPFDPYKE